MIPPLHILVIQLRMAYRNVTLLLSPQQAGLIIVMTFDYLRIREMISQIESGINSGFIYQYQKAAAGKVTVLADNS